MSSTLSRVDGATLPLPATGWRATLNDYYELTKPRIIMLLLVTTVAAMIMAARGLPPPLTVLWTLIGGAFAAASAGAFNCVYDADVDARMQRTMSRPVPRGTITASRALTFGMLLGIAAFLILDYLVNPLAAWLSLAGNAYYVFIYTMWLKRRTPQNIVIGGAAGSVPPLVGWAAVTGTIGAPAIVLAAIIFLWTPPHFWALALMTDTDYDRAGIPMLPNVKGVDHTKVEIVAYSAGLLGFCALAVALHVLGPIFLIASLLLNGRLLWLAWRLLRDRTKRYARMLFRFSLLYLALMCLATVADRIVL